jgi:hypothetical protein
VCSSPGERFVGRDEILKAAFNMTHIALHVRFSILTPVFETGHRVIFLRNMHMESIHQCVAHARSYDQLTIGKRGRIAYWKTEWSVSHQALQNILECHEPPHDIHLQQELSSKFSGLFWSTFQTLDWRQMVNAFTADAQVTFDGTDVTTVNSNSEAGSIFRQLFENIESVALRPVREAVGRNGSVASIAEMVFVSKHNCGASAVIAAHLDFAQDNKFTKADLHFVGSSVTRLMAELNTDCHTASPEPTEA